MAVLLTPPKIQFFGSDGTTPNASGLVYFYTAGTDTPKDTYTDQGGGTPNANPVVLDSAGRAAIWINGSYKVVVKTSAGVTISTTDNVTSFSASSGTTVTDSTFIIQDNSDTTKQLQFQCSSIGTGTTTTITVPDGNATMATVTGTQTLTSKTLTSPTLTTPTFSGLSLGFYRGAVVYNNANQTITTGTPTLVTFNTETIDTDSIHSTSVNTSRMTVPTGVTKVRLRCNASFAGDATGVQRLVSILKNGSDCTPKVEVNIGLSETGTTDVCVSSPALTCVATDYFEMRVSHDRGGNLDLNTSQTWFEMEILG